MILRKSILLIAGLGLAACTNAQVQRERQQQRSATTFLDRQGSIGDPGRVAAADFRFARMARDEGQWTAFAATMADGALLHGRNGPIAAAPWVAAQSDPDEAVAWAPNTVWSSCDGRVAVSFGRFRDPEGLVGSYATVWQLQRDNSYKWVYDMAGPDVPQPEPEAAPDIPEDAIVVEGIPSITGLVADCPRGDAPTPLLSVEATTPGARQESYLSPDNTLRWSWSHGPDQQRSFTLQWLRYGEWQRAVKFVVPSTPEG